MNDKVPIRYAEREGVMGMVRRHVTLAGEAGGDEDLMMPGELASTLPGCSMALPEGLETPSCSVCGATPPVDPKMVIIPSKDGHPQSTVLKCSSHEITQSNP
jgi:hypothetical protein